MTDYQTTFDFASSAEETSPIAVQASIPGLHYIPSFLDQRHQDEIVERIDDQPWLADLGRRVQQYGWRYDYNTRSINKDMRIGPLPSWLSDVATKLRDLKGLFDTIPNQAIINEYVPGQGIAMHVDRHCFGPTVATVSLGDDWCMDLKHLRRKTKKQLLLEQGSALVLTGIARNQWLHGISKRHSETDRNGRRPRRRRISLTFRTVSVA